MKTKPAIRPRGPALTLSVVSLLVLAALLAAIFFQVGAVREAREALAAERRAVVQMEERRRYLLELQKNIPAWKQYVDAHLSLIPAGPEENTLLIELHEMAFLAGVHDFQVGFGEPVARPGYTEIPLTLRFEGSYRSTLRFLDELRYGVRAIRVDKVNLVSGGAGPSGLKAEITAAAFHRGDSGDEKAASPRQ